MDAVLVSLVSIIVVGVLSQWVAARIGVPSILLLLAAGLLAGPVTGALDPDDLFGKLLLPVVSLSVALILFEGGMSLRLRELRRVGGVVLRLCTLGALVTWLGGTLLARVMFGVDWHFALLLGSLFIVTGPTVIGPLLRQVRPRGGVAPVLKWEGIVTDPLGVMVAILVFESLVPHHGGRGALGGILLTLGVGGAVGVLGGMLLTWLLRRHLVADHLQNPMAMLFVVAAFGACEQVQAESGLLAVTAMGVVLANQRAVVVRHIVEFKESLQVLLLSVLFVVLAARVEISMITELSWSHFVFLAGLILLVRPAAVLASSLGSAMPWRERIFVAGVAPRGIVAAAMASVIALELDRVGHAQARMIVPLTFLVIIGTVVVYGLGAPLLARLLGLSSTAHRGVLILGAHEWSRAMAQALRKVGADVLLVDTNRRHVTQARMEGLPVVQKNILAEGAFDDIDLIDKGLFLATTANDEVNALSCLHLRELFGRSKVFQLVSEDESEGDEVELGGRRLFGEGVTFPVLAARNRQGWHFKATSLSESFDLDDYRERYGEEAIPLFVVTENGRIHAVDSELPVRPREGQKLVGLVPPDTRPA